MKKAITFSLVMTLLVLVLLFPNTENRLLATTEFPQNPAGQDIARHTPTAMAKPLGLNILEGQQVEKGEVLASLDRKSFFFAVDAANAKFQASKLDYKQALQLYQEKVISKTQLDTATSVQDITCAELDIKIKTLADIISREGFVAPPASGLTEVRAGSITTCRFNLPPLVSYSRDHSLGKHQIPPTDKTTTAFYLGIDVGDDRYLITRGKAAASVNKGLEAFREIYCKGRTLLGTGVTGSDCYLLGKMVGADEITAQAKAAVVQATEVSTGITMQPVAPLSHKGV